MNKMLLYTTVRASLVNVLPMLCTIEQVKPTFGVVRKYFGQERVLCDPPNGIGNPAYRMFHKVYFEGEEMMTYVPHADFKKNPDFQILFPTHEQQRKLDHLNS